METKELIRKCKAITLEGEEVDQFIFEGQMKENLIQWTMFNLWESTNMGKTGWIG